MQTKLTIRLDSNIIKKAKREAARRNLSLSKLVADYFVILVGDKNGNQLTHRLVEQDLQLANAPLTSSLLGVLKDKDSTVDESDYRNYLETKYL